MQSKQLNRMLCFLFIFAFQLCIPWVSSLSEESHTERIAEDSKIKQQHQQLSSSSSRTSQGEHQNNNQAEHGTMKQGMALQQTKKAYVTLITSDREVDKALVMLASLFAMTKTRQSMTPKGEKGGERNSSPHSDDIDYGQCHLDGKFDVQCDYHHHDHDYICLIIPKENNDNFQRDSFLKNFNLGVSHSNVQKLIWAGCDVKPIPYSIYNPSYDVDTNDEEQALEEDTIGKLWPTINYNQIWIWSLKPHYDILIYISIDHIVLSDINHLFDLDEFWGAYDAPLPFIAAPHDHIVSNQFHSGFMVIKPDLSTFQTMVTLIKHGDIGYAASGNNIDNEKMAYEHSIQHFLNAKIFPEWYSMPKEYRLGPKYSTPFEWTLHEYVWLSHRNQVAIIQFTPYYKPDEIIRNPAKYQTSKYATPIIYLWTLIMFFVTAPLVNLEEETRYVLHEVFGITDDSDDVIAYIKRMKRGGTRRRLGLQ